MNIDIVRASEADSLLEDDEFRVDWKKLCRECSWATSFQDPDFACTWYRIYRSRFEPVLVLSRGQEGMLEGLIPLAISTVDGRLVVAGDLQAEYQVWICSSRLGDQFIRQTVQRLQSEFPTAVLTLRYLPPGTPTSWLASAEAKRNCRLISHRRPLLELGDASETVKSLNKKSNKSRLNRLEKVGTLEFKRIVDAKELEEHLNDIIHCYDLRQAVVHGVAPFRDDDLKKRFHLAMMRFPGLLHATVLKLGNQFGAAHLGVCGAKEVQLGIIAHNPLLSKHSPGKFHILFLAQMLVGEGYKRLDLTPGGDPYKERFANSFDDVHALTVFFSPKQRMKDLIRTGLGKIARTSLQPVGIEPEDLKSLGSNLKRIFTMDFLGRSVQSARQWIGRRREMRIYSHDATSGQGLSGPVLVRNNALDDLLRHQPAGGFPSSRQFLSTVLYRIESGARIYSCSEDNRLLSFGWLVERQEKFLVSEVGQELVLPPNSACLFDFFASPQAQQRELLTPIVWAMLRDVAGMSGVSRTFIVASADDTPLRQAIEEVGFAYECSMFEEVVFGRSTRWSVLTSSSRTSLSWRTV